MKVLVIKLRSVGDVLLTTPLIRNIGLSSSDALIDVMVNADAPGKGTAEILSFNPHIRKIIAYDKEHMRGASFLKRLAFEVQTILKLRREKYDVVINLDHGERGGFVAFLSGANVRVGFSDKAHIRKIYNKYLEPKKTQHVVDFNLQALDALNLKVVDKRLEVFWSDKDLAMVVDKLQDSAGHAFSEEAPFVHIHPSSRGEAKCIKNETMSKIVDFCELELGLRVVITAAPLADEMERVEEILGLCKSSPLNLSGQLTLLQTAALNNLATFFIGVDTAVMHISAANDTPAFVFFGPTAIDNWGPWSNESSPVYNRNQRLQRVGKHVIYAEQRDCLPCSKNGCDHGLVSECLMDLDIDLIKAQVQDMANEHLST